MARIRFNIASLLIVILVLGVGVAALRESSNHWDRGIFTLILAGRPQSPPMSLPAPHSRLIERRSRTQVKLEPCCRLTPRLLRTPSGRISCARTVGISVRSRNWVITATDVIKTIRARMREFPFNSWKLS
jgi:hypothetical protein